MKNRIWRAHAPSNIALIKYMGKTDQLLNRPTNTSLSYTLSHLKSVVELELAEGVEDRWEALTSFEGRRLEPLALAGRGRERFMNHLGFLKRGFGDTRAFVVRSANDFPADCGLASSASSFAALTKAGLAALAEVNKKSLPPAGEAAEMSRQGSGSSCRSFFEPWSIWDENGARAVPELGGVLFKHQVIVVDEAKKAVSSSEAHKRVASSALFAGRPERAEVRVRELVAALKAGDLGAAFELSWAEFWDMHALFETSRPSFGYMNAGSLEALRFVRGESWEKHGRGPLVTMDAGPNVHLLYATDSANCEFMKAFAAEVRRRFEGKYKVFSEDWP